MRTRLVLASAVAAIALWPAPASAHASLEGSEPSDGARVEVLSELFLRFSEPPEPALSEMALLDESGSAVRLGALEVRALEMRAPIEGELAPGTYVATWRVLSRADGHVTAGAFVFGFQVDPADLEIPEPQQPGVTVLGVASRALFLLGFALAFGAGLVELLSPLAVRMLPILAWGGSVAAFAGVAALGHQQRLDSGASVADFLSTSIGQAVIWRAAPLVLAVLLAVAWRRWMRRRTIFAVTMLASLVAVAVVHVGNGHAAASGSRQIAIQVAHMLAASAWVGGLVPLLAAIKRGNARRVVTRFSTIALGLVVVVVGSGVVRAFDGTGTFLLFTGGGYGRTAALKGVLLIGILWFAAQNRRRNVAILGEDPAPLTRAVRIEAGIAVVVLGVTGLLGNLSPQVEASEPVAVEATRTNFAGTVEATLSAEPGRVGANRFTLSVVRLPSEEPIDDAEVTLRFRYRGRPGLEPTEMTLERTGPGVYEATSAWSPAGPFEISALIQTATGSDEVVLPLATRTDQRVTELGGEPQLTSVRLADGSSVQVYIDPEAPGRAEVHATFFAEDGRERLDLTEIVIVASGPDGVRPLVPRMLTPGHPVAEVFLSVGDWRFDVSAMAPNGDVLGAWFEREIA